MRFAITAFASRQARGRRRWESSSATNSSSNYALTIRCRTMTAIHRSGRCDNRDTKRHEKSPWMSPGIFLLLPATRTPPRRWSCRKLLRRECEGCQCATLSPGACSSAPHCYTQRTESPIHSGLVGRSPATLKKRIPINNHRGPKWRTQANPPRHRRLR